MKSVIWAKLSKMIVGATMAAGLFSVSAACWGIFYQPEMPAKLRK